MNLSPVGFYTNVARLSETGAVPAPSSEKEGRTQDARSFSTALASAARQAISTGQAAEAAAMQGLAGTMDAHQVVAAMTQAELTIQATVAIRDKMVQAYQEIMRMPV
jgi:flagellar hook-basal body complex protein FliE